MQVLDLLTKLHEQQFGKKQEKPAPQPQKDEKKSQAAKDSLAPIVHEERKSIFETSKDKI